ncbi:MAG: transporter ATP-binding protein [Candidatus Saccharibacteria bacterium]|nr:transporter ATP-binding protein [Candidatus Saccharibacteria bacterium]
MRQGLRKYQLVYGHLWRTFGSSWLIRTSYVIQLLTRICKLIALPIALSLIITRLSRHDYGGAQKAVLLYVSFSALLGALTPLVKYIGMRGENKVYRSLTAAYFEKLVSSDLEYFNSNLSGYLTTATRQYVDGCVQLVRSLRDRYSTTLLSIVFPLCVILWLDIPLGLVTLALSVLNAAYMIWASHTIGPYRTRSRELYKRNSGRMADIISNILAVKSTAQEASYIARVRDGAWAEAAIFRERYTVQARLIAARELITVTVFATLFSLTIHRMSGGHITITTAVLVVTYATTILTGIYSLSDDLDEHDDTVDRIIPAFEILGRENVVTDPAVPQHFTDDRGKITFQNVSFSYEKGSRQRAVLKDFSLAIPQGQKLGVVGISGAGKSTLTKLLLRFNDVDEGHILLGDVDIRTVLQTELRSQIAYVSQEPLLFHDSIRENVAVAKPDATDVEILAALRAAHALEFVDALPDGLDSVVGERGVKLSGGQKQRVAIARAVLQHAPIIVLDEATSALDSESEQIIKDSFAEVLKNKTAIVVAHRLSTLSEMDRIIVLQRGKLVEDGTHEALLKLHGVYAGLWKRQQHT